MSTQNLPNTGTVATRILRAVEDLKPGDVMRYFGRNVQILAVSNTFTRGNETYITLTFLDYVDLYVEADVWRVGSKRSITNP